MVEMLANLFFKRHGVNELQIVREKYATKAAQEYRKHLQKSVLDNGGHAGRIPSIAR